METLSPGGPLLTSSVAERLIVAQDRAQPRVTVSLDLGRTTCIVEPGQDAWSCALGRFPYPFGLQQRTVYGWDGDAFQAVETWADNTLVRLVPTDAGPPVCEIDGVDSPLPADQSPGEDAWRKATRISPRGKRVLDCCGGLGYLAQACLAEGAEQVVAHDASDAFRCLRAVNPWSPRPGARLRYMTGDLAQQLEDLPDDSFDAVLRDPAIAESPGQLPSPRFFHELARVIAPEGLLLHGSGPALPPGQRGAVLEELRRRLHAAGFVAARDGDWVVARMPAQAVLAARLIRSRR